MSGIVIPPPPPPPPPPPFIALPPGIYNIQSSDTKNVVNPGTNGQQLSVASPSTDAKQQWLINGNGIMLAMDVETFSYSDLSQSGTPQQVNRSGSSKVEWIIKVQASDDDKSFSGAIMSNDSTKRYWGLNGNNVELQDSSYTWKFVPV